MKNSALHLAAMGWPVHPVHGITPEGLCTCGRGAGCPSAGKHPCFSDWGVQATTDVKTIRSWDWEGRNLGVVPGKIFTILDFDGADGRALLRRMSDHLPDLPEDTPIAQTGSGGYHVFIRGQAKSSVKILPGLDIRGVGGQVVAPLSKHFSGGFYKWLNPPKGLPPEAPLWLQVAQGKIPDALRPEDIITKDDIKILAKGYPAINAALKGKPFAEPDSQIRNKTAVSIAGKIARQWPYASPDHIAEIFRESIDKMGGEPTIDSFTKMIQRYQNFHRERLKERPRIFVSTDIEEVSDKALEALANKATDLGIYSRGGMLVRVRPKEGLPDGVLRGELPSVFEVLNQGNLITHLSQSAEFVKRKEDGVITSTYPPATTVVRLEQRGSWPGINHAERITHGMTLRPDGGIFRGGGYDFVTATVAVGHRDDTPLVSLDESLVTMQSVVSDFPFSNPESYSAWLASILTAVGQTVFPGPSPLFLIDANVRGAGKTLLAEISIRIATGKSPTKATLGVNNEEDRKQITAMAISGAQCIFVDNVSGLFGTPKLCEALSLHDSGWSDRILGKSKTWSGPFKPTWFATSNNIRLQPDVSRRTCYIRLDSLLEKPELRSGFKHPSLFSWVKENQREFYRAAISILHHYLSAGSPLPQEPLSAWGGFEGWTDLIRHAIVWAGLKDPAETRVGLAIADEEQDLLNQLLDGLQEFELDLFTPTDICAALYGQSAFDNVLKYSVLRDALETGCVQKQTQPTPQSVGKLFIRFRERVCDGRRLVKLADKRRSTWQVQMI